MPIPCVPPHACPTCSPYHAVAYNEANLGEPALVQLQHISLGTCLALGVGVVYASIAPILKGVKQEAFGEPISNFETPMFFVCANIFQQHRSPPLLIRPFLPSSGAHQWPGGHARSRDIVWIGVRRWCPIFLMDCM